MKASSRGSCGCQLTACFCAASWKPRIASINASRGARLGLVDDSLFLGIGYVQGQVLSGSLEDQNRAQVIDHLPRELARIGAGGGRLENDVQPLRAISVQPGIGQVDNRFVSRCTQDLLRPFQGDGVAGGGN